jgi:large subunit ribosomal protein L20
MKAQYWAYRDRKTRKRTFRNLWILRINAACRQLGTTYSRFIEGLAAAQITIDRRILAELAVNDAVAFKNIVDKAVAALEQKKTA